MSLYLVFWGLCVIKFVELVYLWRLCTYFENTGPEVSLLFWKEEHRLQETLSHLLIFNLCFLTNTRSFSYVKLSVEIL